MSDHGFDISHYEKRNGDDEARRIRTSIKSDKETEVEIEYFGDTPEFTVSVKTSISDGKVQSLIPFTPRTRIHIDGPDSYEQLKTLRKLIGVALDEHLKWQEDQQ